EGEPGGSVRSARLDPGSARALCRRGDLVREAGLARAERAPAGAARSRGGPGHAAGDEIPLADAAGGGERHALVRIAGVQVGRPAKTAGMRTGFGKSPVAGGVRVGHSNLEGDGQADRRYHGGPDMAVLAYCAGHYPRPGGASSIGPTCRWAAL